MINLKNKVNKEKKRYKHVKKNPIKIGIIATIVIAIVIMIAMYISNESFRNIIDRYVLQKEATENNVATIKIDSEANPMIYAYDKYITVLNRNVMQVYSSGGKKEGEIDIAISNPIYSSNNRFLAVAEQDGRKIYLVSGQNIIWQQEVDGQIYRMNVNKNGYISIAVSQTSYKTVIITFDPNGKELFKTYLSTTYAIDTDISNDNKYLAVAEVDSTGSMIKSKIKIISIEQAQNTPSDSIIYTYSADANDIVSNIKYQDRNKLVCMYDNKIQIIENNQSTVLTEMDDSVLFADINLSGHVAKISKKATALFMANSEVSIINLDTNKENLYAIEGTPKDIHCYENTVAVNLGTEVHFISNNGWLIKKYLSSQEVKDVVLGGNLAGIVYKDKIEIVSI